MLRKAVLGLGVSALMFAGLAAAAWASSPIRLYMSGGAAFAVLGHSCGGIQEKVYATGFASNGYPMGNVSLSTTCGGSGKGGGGHSTTYTGTAGVVWTWYGETRSYSTPGGTLEAVAAEDSHGDRVYNVGTAAYLEDGAFPPIKPPAAPTGIGASVALAEEGESEFLRLYVGWTVDPETAGLLQDSTITATPKIPGPPVLTRSVIPYFSSSYINRVEPNTTYVVTVTSTDAEGTSEPSAPLEIKTPNSDGEAEKEKSTTSACEQNTGTIKLSPGLSETPHVQNITIKGTLTGCGGALGMESGTYIEHLKSKEELTCSALQSASLEPTTELVSLSVKWAPAEEGKSKGSLILPITETSLTGLTGTLEGGPFAAPTAVTAASVSESFSGGPSCGVAEGNKKAKAVKAGTFSTSEVEFG